MATRTIHEQDRQPQPRLTSEQVWRALGRASFAVLSHVTPGGEPRSSGVVYKASGRRLFVAVAPGSWKARHVAADGRVAVTVPVRRGGILSLVAPIPPATISFHGTAVVHPAGSPRARLLLDETGLPCPRGPAGGGVRHRDHPGRGVPHLRDWRLAAGDAQPGRGPGTRAGHAGRGYPVTAPPGQAAAGPERGPAAIASRHPAVGLAVGVVRRHDRPPRHDLPH